jgi:uncharacterized protein with PIN domain
MVDIEVAETSLVDHPAHLVEGWVVMKSADEKAVSDLFGTIDKGKENEVADKEEAPAVIKQADHDAVLEEVETLKAKLTAAEQKIADAEAEKADAAKKNPFGKSAEELAKEEFEKSVPESVRTLMNKQAEDLQKARDEIAKERDARLDAAAVHESQATFKSLAFDHEKVAPALRKFASLDADTAKAVVEVLKAAEGQLESAGIFQELGKSAAGSTGSALDEASVMAKSAMEADPKLSFAQALDNQFMSNPELYTRYTEGK